MMLINGTHIRRHLSENDTNNYLAYLCRLLPVSMMLVDSSQANKHYTRKQRHIDLQSAKITTLEMIVRLSGSNRSVANWERYNEALEKIILDFEKYGEEIPETSGVKERTRFAIRAMSDKSKKARNAEVAIRQLRRLEFVNNFNSNKDEIFCN